MDSMNVFQARYFVRGLVYAALVGALWGFEAHGLTLAALVLVALAVALYLLVIHALMVVFSDSAVRR